MFDGIFNNNNAQDAAAAQTAGLQQGLSTATNAVNTGQTNTNADYATALAPINSNLATTQAGQTNYANALGVNGQAGYDQAVQNFQTGPGYQFALDQGSQNVMRNQNATGQLASGATDTALLNYGQGMANQQWQNYLTNLQPFIGASTANAATGAATGTAKAGTDANAANTLANLNWSASTGIGNANANADLAQTGVNANILNAGMKGADLAASLISFL